MKTNHSLIAEICSFSTVLTVLSPEGCFEVQMPNEICCASVPGTVREDGSAVCRILDWLVLR